MSTRYYLPPQQVLDASMASNQTSNVTILGPITGCSYGVSWSGSSPTGTLAVEGSNDYQLSFDGKTVVNAGTWNTLYLEFEGNIVASVPVSGNSGNAMLDITKTQIYAVRLVYTASGGSGMILATISGKVA